MIFKKKISFPEALATLISLLEKVNETHWLRVVESLRADGEGFRKIFGGMGTFNDLIICDENGHSTERSREPLANEWFSCLSSIAYAASQQRELSAEDAVASCGSTNGALQGIRCLVCGMSHVPVSNIIAYHSYHSIRKKIRDGVRQGRLTDIFEDDWKGFDAERIVALYRKAIRASDMEVTDRFEMMRPCPQCGGNDTAIYRWDWAGGRFLPSSDNLEMKHLTNRRSQ